MKSSILGLGTALFAAFVLNLIFSQFDLRVYGIVLQELLVSDNNTNYDIGLLGSKTFISYSVIRSLFVFGIPGFLLPVIMRKSSFLHAVILIVVFVAIQALHLFISESQDSVEVFLLNGVFTVVFTLLGIMIGNKVANKRGPDPNPTEKSME